MLRWNKKNEAFTLVEVLAVIVILGILSTIGIVTITNIRKNQEKKFDQTQRELFRQTAKTYFSDNKTKLPVIPRETSKVYLEELIDENYLDSLLDYNKNSYELDSYVEILKIGEGLYYYDVQLRKKDDSEYIPDNSVDTEEEVVTFNFYKKGTTEITKDSGKYYSNKSVNVGISIKDSDIIMAYCYSIYKDGIKIYTSEFILGNKKTEMTDVITLDLAERSDGKYKIELVVYDMKNHVKTNKSDEIVIDRVPPKCTVSGGSTTWINQKSTTQYRTITAKCSDKTSGCTKDSIEEKYEDNINTTTAGAAGDKQGGTVYDKAGNSTDCPANQIVKIDKTAPKCTTQGESTKWTNADRELSFYCSDSTSGCVTSVTKRTYTETNKTLTINYVKVKDNAGNTTTCKSAKNTFVFNIYVDKVKPTISSFVVNTRDTNSRYNTRIANPTATITENLSDEVEYSIKVDDKTKTTVTIENYPDISNMISKVITMSTEHDGSSHTVKLCAKDLAGNQTCKEKTYTVYKKCTNIIESLNAPCGLVTITYPDKYLGGSCKPSIQETRITAAPNTCYVGNTSYSTAVHKNASGVFPSQPYQIGNGDCASDTSGHWIYCTNSSGQLLTMLNRNWTYNRPHSQWACNFNFNPDFNPNIKVGSVIEIPKGSGTTFQVIDDSNPDFWKWCSNSFYY